MIQMIEEQAEHNSSIESAEVVKIWKAASRDIKMHCLETPKILYDMLHIRDIK